MLRSHFIKTAVGKGHVKAVTPTVSVDVTSLRFLSEAMRGWVEFAPSASLPLSLLLQFRIMRNRVVLLLGY